MLHILETLSQNSTRFNAKRRIDSPLDAPKTKRVKSELVEPPVPPLPEGTESDLYCSAYMRDISKTMLSENERLFEENVFDSLPDRKQFMKKRRKLLNWLFPITRSHKCNSAVVYKMTQLIDVYLSKCTEFRSNHMQLIGSVALLLASKYHDRITVPFESMVEFSGGAFSYNDLVLGEMELLQAIDFNLTNPLILNYIQWFLLHFSQEKHQSALKRVSLYLAESLMLEGDFVGVKPMYHATVAVYWALQMVPRTKWDNRFTALFGVSEEQLQAHAQTILRCAFPNFKLTGVQKVYFDTSAVIGKIFRNKDLKAWLQRRCDRHSRRKKSLILSGH